MITALWILNIVLAVAFVGTGLLKLVRSKESLAAAGLGWTEDFSEPQVKALGLAELLGAIGLVVPLATGIAPALAPIAAVALAVLLAGAIATHARRGETRTAGFIVAVILAILSVASAVIGFIVVLG